MFWQGGEETHALYEKDPTRHVDSCPLSPELPFPPYKSPFTYLSSLRFICVCLHVCAYVCVCVCVCVCDRLHIFSGCQPLNKPSFIPTNSHFLCIDFKVASRHTWIWYRQVMGGSGTGRSWVGIEFTIGHVLQSTMSAIKLVV
jgi:hypothetical protein